MRVICDTNIWYYLSQNTPEEKFYKENNLISTFISIDELSKSFNIVRNQELVQNSIRAIFKYSERENNTIYDPPLVYLKKLSNPSFEYDTYSKHRVSFDFTSKLATGVILADSDKQEIKKYCLDREKRIKDFTDIFNVRASEIQLKIKNKKKHREEYSWELNKEFINFLVGSYTKTEGLDENFDWNKIDLFLKVLKVFFNDMELGARKMQINDVNDLFQLIYVKPNEKFWTKEVKWIRYIKDLKLDNYLFDK